MRLVFKLETSRFFAVLALGVALLFASGAGVLAQGTRGNSNQTQVVFQNGRSKFSLRIPAGFRFQSAGGWPAPSFGILHIRASRDCDPHGACNADPCGLLG